MHSNIPNYNNNNHKISIILEGEGLSFLPLTKSQFANHRIAAISFFFCATHTQG